MQATLNGSAEHATAQRKAEEIVRFKQPAWAAALETALVLVGVAALVWLLIR